MHRYRHFMGDGFRRSRHGWSGFDRHAERHAERDERRSRRHGRFFDHGDLRIVVLALLAEQARHGYDLMKELEERTGGAYRPSPGVVYPTLALLEDEGLIRQTDAGGGRKAFEITDAGKAEVEKNRPLIDGLFARMNESSQHASPGRPRIGRAMMNLGMAIKNRMSRPVSPEELDRIVNMIDDTAAAIERS